MLNRLEDIWLAITFAEAGEHTWAEAVLVVSADGKSAAMPAVAETI